MALSVTSKRHFPKVRCLKIDYTYSDLELHEDLHCVSYVDSVEDLPAFFNELINDNHILDVHHHPYARLNPSFKISSVSLSQKEYNKLFNV